MTINYYEILGVAPDATEKDILRGYRKKALTCHPDKNPDNPKAAQLFIELSEALEVLIDATARAALDNVLKAKQAAKLRTQTFDAKRKKFKEDLEKREKSAENEKHNEEMAAEQLAAQIKKLREEGSRLLREQQELIRKQLSEEKSMKESHITPKLKVKWSASKKDHQNGGYNEALLLKLFSKYGHVSAVVLSRKKNGLAIIEFGSVAQANIALEFEKGLEENPVMICWLDRPKEEAKVPTCDKECSNGSAESDPVSVSINKNNESNQSDFDNFEALVLKRMKQAEERKRTTQQIIVTDKQESTEHDVT